MTEQNKSVSVFRETETPEGTTENLNNSKTTGKKSKPIVSGYGAAPGDWNHFDLFLELTEDLLPVVSNPHAVKSPLSKIAGPGKTPSIYNKKGQMAGFPKWTEYRATLDDVEKWSKQPDYGICLITRTVRAIDVDISDFDESVDVEAFVDAHLGFKLPCRRRSNASKFAFLFTLPGEMTKRRFKTKTEGNFIELLGSGQQIIVSGTHTSGVRYEWDGGLPERIPTLTSDQFEALWTALNAKFGSEASVSTRAGKPDRDMTKNMNGVHDPVVDYLYEKGLVTDVTPSGDVCVDCPEKAGHSSDNGPSETVWHPAGTGGYAQGHFDCKHESCKSAIKTDQDFLDAIGYSSHDFDVIEYTPEENAAQQVIQKRNRAKATRTASAAIEKAKFTSGRDVFEQTRREYQKKQNEIIGEGEDTIPTAEVITLVDALNRFVFLSDGSRVADVFNPHYDLAQSDWAMTYAASSESVPQPDKELSSGRRVKVVDKEVPVSKLWATSPKRKTVVCRTFKAGGALVLNDPQGRRALNGWKPYDRSIEVGDTEAAGLPLFLDHINFLFGADASRFLDWLAHIEQTPGELPHTAWLHIATNFGMGRNWLASVLTRVWAGAVAANLDLVGMFEKGFNDRMSRKVLAVVDEIREGGRDSQWEHSEKLKGVITEEHRTINPKYGRVTVEFNACRFLMFSQHLSAIPMEKGDRRIEVVVTEATPKPASYYTNLYTALNDPLFIAAVAKFLGDRDISGFNPGAHAKQTEAKQAATKASQTPTAAWCELVVKHWPSDLITAGDLYAVLTGREAVSGDSLNAGHRKTLEQCGIVAMGKKRKIDGNVVALSIVRNKGHWMAADTDEIKTELHKALTGLENARDYLGGIEAESAN